MSTSFLHGVYPIGESLGHSWAQRLGEVFTAFCGKDTKVAVVNVVSTGVRRTLASYWWHSRRVVLWLPGDSVLLRLETSHNAIVSVSSSSSLGSPCPAGLSWWFFGFVFYCFLFFFFFLSHDRSWSYLGKETLNWELPLDWPVSKSMGHCLDQWGPVHCGWAGVLGCIKKQDEWAVKKKPESSRPPRLLPLLLLAFLHWHPSKIRMCGPHKPSPPYGQHLITAIESSDKDCCWMHFLTLALNHTHYVFNFTLIYYLL